MPMPSTRSFSPQDRQDFDRLKELLDKEFQREADNAVSLRRQGLYIKEVHNRELYRIAGAGSLGEWTELHYDIGERQAGKYINVATNLSDEEVRAYALEIEALDQMAHAPLWLRETLQKLFKKEGLGVGPVTQGRLAAERLKKKGATEAAA